MSSHLLKIPLESRAQLQSRTVSAAGFSPLQETHMLVCRNWVVSEIPRPGFVRDEDFFQFFKGWRYNACMKK